MNDDQLKELRSLIETRLAEVYGTLQVGEVPKSVRKVFSRSARKISAEIKSHLKKEAKRERKRKKAEIKSLKSKRKKKPSDKK